MHAVGIICEYNPLHSGHLFQLNEARKLSGCDTVICVMSGAFVQRGFPAVCDAFTRTKWALKAGADCVIELPAVYSLSPADNFASGGIRMIEATGIADAFSCGVSTDDVSLHEQIAAFLNREPDSFSSELQQRMKKGSGYPSAITETLCSHFPQEKEAVLALMNNANDVLAVRYLTENMKLTHPIRFFPVKRTGSVSSSSIRAKLLNGDTSYASSVPEFVLRDLNTRIQYFDYDALLAGMLRRANPDELAALPDVSEGLIHHLLENGRRFSSASQIVEATAGKNTTKSHVWRILWYLYLGITKELQIQARSRIPYIRVLGVRQGRKDILSELQRNAEVPVCVSASELPNDEYVSACARIDALSYDIQALCNIPPSSDLWFRHPLATDSDLSNC